MEPDAGRTRSRRIEDLKFDNYFKEMYLDSDTKIALISSSPSEIAQDWFLTNEMMAAAREQGERARPARGGCSRTRSSRPGRQGWLDQLDAASQLKPEFVQGLHDRRQHAQGPEQAIPGAWMTRRSPTRPTRRCVKAGIKNVCVHKGLFPPSIEKQFPHLRAYARSHDVGKAAKDWPQLNFIIYHAATATSAAIRRRRWPSSSETGRISWVSRPRGDPGASTASPTSMPMSANCSPQRWWREPRVCAALMGTLVKGLGADHVCWGTDAVWTGSPQWQIEGLRRLEIPEDMQKKYGFTPLGPADGPVKTAIFGGNKRELYNIQPKRAMLELKRDRITAWKDEYEKEGPTRPTCATATWYRTVPLITPCSPDLSRCLSSDDRTHERPGSQAGAFFRHMLSPRNYSPATA